MDYIFTLIFSFILSLIHYLPNFDVTGVSFNWVDLLLQCCGYLNSFIGLDIFLVAVGHSLFFWTAEAAWAVIEWIYKKIPGVD